MREKVGMMCVATLAMAFGLASCVTVPSTRSLAAPGPVFSAERFFAGSTEGEGQLKVLFSAPRPIRVHGTGRIDPDGALVLAQEVDDSGKRPVSREWRIKSTAPGRYTGTLSDAEGEVTGEVTGNQLHLRYRMKGRMLVEQRIYLQPDGRIALNHMTVSKLGIQVATLEETIRKPGS